MKKLPIVPDRRWYVAWKLKGEELEDEFQGHVNGPSPPVAPRSGSKGITLEIEIMGRRALSTDHNEEQTGIWRITVERKDIGYYRCKSFDVNPSVSLADVESWIGESMTDADDEGNC